MAKTSGGQFIDLAEYRQVSGPGKPRGNIIKSAQISFRGVQQIGAPSERSDDPIVMLEKDGDRIVKAEFVCKCGRSASVQFEYEQE
jgi:hypothetical protein